VDAEYAFFANPSFAFIGYEFSYPVFFDIFEIFNLAHTIFLPVAGIKMLQALAWKVFAFEAKIAGTFLANTHLAMKTGFWMI
jgi:hypothetical protein